MASTDPGNKKPNAGTADLTKVPTSTALLKRPLIGIVMGSRSDWETMSEAESILIEFDVPCEVEVVSAHRTPLRVTEYAEAAASRGLQVIIAGAGGAAHLPGMLAAQTDVPVLGVPVASKHLQGMDSLLSIVQMPKGVPVGTLAIGAAGAANAALLALRILAISDPQLRRALGAYRDGLRASVSVANDPRE